MPLEAGVTPKVTKQGALGEDDPSTPGSMFGKTNVSQGLKGAKDYSYQKMSSGPSGTDLSKKNMFTMDNDMGLIKNAGKSGKY